MRKIILASASKQRRAYFEMIFGDNFEVCASDYKEENDLDMLPEKLSVKLAKGKAREVAEKYEDAIVVGCDTFVYLDGKVVGKPKDTDDAVNILKLQSGRILEVYSGLCIIDTKNNTEITDFAVSKVFFAKLSNNEIKKYVDTEEWVGKAGGWANLGKAGMFIERIEGCMANVAGMPLNKLYVILKKMGLNVFEY
ncbi:MAG: nucleoside triphosphate pyrophosphatase [archaeon]